MIKSSVAHRDQLQKLLGSRNNEMLDPVFIRLVEELVEAAVFYELEFSVTN